MSEDKLIDYEELKRQVTLYWKCCFDLMNKHLEEIGSDILFIIKD